MLRSMTLVLLPQLMLGLNGPALTAQHQQPTATGDGWTVGALSVTGADMTRLAELVAAIHDGELSNLHSVLVAQDGVLVFEQYFEGSDERRGEALGTVRFDQTTLHDLRSVTKTITGALVGLAAEQGALRLDAPVPAVLDLPIPVARDKAALTVRHLLTMTSGLEWDERSHPYTDPRNSETAMDLSESSVEYVLSQELVDPPGTRFAYCGGCTMVLAAAVREATGLALDRFAEEHLFGPLGIDDFEWYQHQDGLPIAASGLRLRPRDMLKFGQLYLDEGRWQGRQVLPSTWVAESTSLVIQLDSISGYGYQWWVDLEPVDGEVEAIPVARGNGGQRIYLVRSLGLVVAITAGNYNSADSRMSEFAFWRYILPAFTESMSER